MGGVGLKPFARSVAILGDRVRCCGLEGLSRVTDLWLAYGHRDPTYQSIPRLPLVKGPGGVKRYQKRFSSGVGRAPYLELV